MGQLMGLVNCAGIAIGVKPVGKDGAHPLAQFARVININLVGSFNMIHPAAQRGSDPAGRGDSAGAEVIPSRLGAY